MRVKKDSRVIEPDITERESLRGSAPRREPKLAFVTAICVLIALLGAPAAHASDAILGAFGTPNGQGAGQLSSNVRAIAVNRSGAGGAGAGDVYVVDSGNQRIQQFDAEGNFIRAFGWGVVTSGPDNVTPANAVQSVNVPASVTGGTFALTFNGKTTAPLPFNATAAEVEAALIALSSIPDEFGPNVKVTGGPGASAPYTISFTNELSQTPVPLLGADSSGLSGGSVAVSMTTAGASNYEICDVEAHPTDVCRKAEANVNGNGPPIIGLGAMFDPNGIAVDQANGNVYVSDGSYERIDIFSAAGKPEGAFAWGVVDGSPELQFCTEICLRGVVGAYDPLGEPLEAGGGQFNLGQIGHLDVAPNGDLFVADTGNARIDRFEPQLSGGVVTGVSFFEAFGWDVVESGPDDVPNVTARQLLEIPTSVTGGTFTLTFEGATTGSLPYNVGFTGLSNALNGLTPVKTTHGRIEPIVHGPGEWELVFEGQLRNVPVGQIEVDSSKLVGGTASVSVLSQGASRYEVCDVAAHPGEVCKVGIPGGHGGQFYRNLGNGSALDVAVDSSGTIYAVDNVKTECAAEHRCRIEKFSSAAAYEGEFAPAELSASVPSAAPLGIAVDPDDDHVWVARKNSETSFQILELDSGGNLLGISPPGPGIEGDSDIAIGTGERIYASSREPSGSKILILGPPPPPSATISPVSAIGTTSATFNGAVIPPPPGLFGGYPTFYHFEYSLDGSNWTSVPSDEDVAVGDGTGSGDPNGCPVENPPTCNVSQTVEGLQPNASYQVRLVATTGTSVTTSTVEFSTEPAPPTISSTTAEEVLSESAALTARLNPNNEATSYRFEWGTTSAYGNEAPLGGGSAGSGGEAVRVAAPISGLEPNTAYHFRVLVTNSTGTTTGPDQEFLTLNAAGLPDDRRPELVSVADKRPQGSVEAVFFAQLTYQAAEDGESFVYPILNGLLDSTAGGELRYLAKRTPSGWQSKQLSAPVQVPPPSGEPPSLLHRFTPDLSCGLIETYEPLTADTPPADLELGVTNLYRINPDDTHTLISDTVPSNATASISGPRYNVAGTSPDCSRIFFASPYKFLPGASGLYEWSDGALSDAGLLPDGTVASDAAIRRINKLRIIPNAVSADGERLFFTATSDEGADKDKQAIFLREGEATTDVSQTQTETKPTGARYEFASADGSHLFFAANYGLAATSSSGSSATCLDSSAEVGAGTACDLYDYDTEAGTLTDLSADFNPADTKGAAVEGVLEVSEDGSSVYFVARGQLVPGQGNTYKQNLAGAGFANIYRSYEGNLSFVATVAKSDLDEGLLARAGQTPFPWTVQSTPDGSHLLFVSRASVTGYDSGGVKEAYLYSADSGKTVCISCRPDGQPSLGEPGRLGPLAIITLGEPESNHIPRSLSEDGSRVFFSSKDALAAGAIEGGGAVDLYEWENGQVYLLAKQANSRPSLEFLDSSANGDDVFIRTAQQLDPHDTDSSYDVYDLRVGGGFPPPPTPPLPCVPAEDQCQGPPSAPPPTLAPESAGFNGAGNPLLKKKHGKHRKRHHKHAHKGRHGRHQHKRADNADRRGSK